MAQHIEKQTGWLTAAKATPLEVGPAPYTPGPGQLVVRNAAIGINPFCVGDCVLAMAGLIPPNNTTKGAFQLYTVTREWLTTPQPSHISFKQACALPLALIVAGVGLSRVVITAGGASSVAGTAGLGATDVVDYSSLIMGDKLLAAMRWRQLAGAESPVRPIFKEYFKGAGGGCRRRRSF
ncbi:hypothetical protein N7453_005051 [Penicillium expansum]|nr:hypothetical protein N7453_005051 [Penicillium expansum]